MKKLHAIVLSALIALTFSSQVFATALAPEDLFSDDRITSFAISPTGEYVAYVSPQGNTELFTIAKVDGMVPTFQTQMGSKRYVGRFLWANDERIMLWPAERFGVHEIQYFTGEIQAMNFDGKKNVKLWGYQVKVKQGQQDPRWGVLGINNRLKSDPENIMITTIDGNYGTYGTRRLRKMNIYSGRVTRGERSNIRRAGFIIDNNGESVLQWGSDEKRDNIVTYKDTKGDWQTLPDSKDYIYAWAAEPNHVILKRNGGNNTYQFVKLSLLTLKSTVLATSTNTDMSPVTDRNDKLIGYRSEKDGLPIYVYFDENSEEAQLRRLIAKTFKKHGKARISNGSEDGKRRMVTIYSDQEPGKYYLYDADAKVKLKMIAAWKRKIKRNRFAKMMPISYNARDGLKLQGYLSRPIDSKGNDPMVVMVHGGPFGPRDNWGWDPEVQLLTSNGYAVLQVNFRGSGGYGEEFEESGHLQWGQAMQDDLTDGIDWAVKQGYANKDKLCIYGASYGGYAALMGVVKDPDLYKCAIGYVGVYDLTIMDEVGDIPETKEGSHFVENTIGKEGDPNLVKYSPSHNASKIKAGIFLVHGKQDRRAPIEHYEAMTEALDKIGKPYEKMVADGEGHGFSENENQYKLYNKMLTFLAKYLK